MTHTPHIAPLAYVNKFEDSFNQQQCSGKYKHKDNAQSDTRIYVENLINVRREQPRMWNNRSMRDSL
jgi:hypothetical protein